MPNLVLISDTSILVKYLWTSEFDRIFLQILSCKYDLPEISHRVKISSQTDLTTSVSGCRFTNYNLRFGGNLHSYLDLTVCDRRRWEREQHSITYNNIWFIVSMTKKMSKKFSFKKRLWLFDSWYRNSIEY